MRYRSSVSESRGEDDEEHGAVPVNQDNDKEQDKTNVHDSAEEKEEDPSAFDQDNQDQTKQVVIDMAEDSDAGSVGPPVFNPIAQALVTMTN